MSSVEGQSFKIIKNDEGENTHKDINNEYFKNHEDAASKPTGSGEEPTQMNDYGKETYSGSDVNDDNESTMAGYLDSD